MAEVTTIPLKFKYRRPKPSGRYKSSPGGNNKAAKQHRTLTPAEIERHARQPLVTVHITASGKVVKVRAQAGTK